MYDVISLVLVAAVVAAGTAGTAGLFGTRRRAAATAGRPHRHPGTRSSTPPPYRIVRPPATGSLAGRAGAPVGPAGLPAGPAGRHAGADGAPPVGGEPGPTGSVGPDPDAVLLARGRPSDEGER